MSYHVLHIFQHGSVLSKERGFLVCRGQDKEEKRLPHEDVRAVIIAARGVTLTSSFMSAICETDGIILHCNESYQPCGMTAPLARLVDAQAFFHQTERPKKHNTQIWAELLRGKNRNQQLVLKHRILRLRHCQAQ